MDCCSKILKICVCIVHSVHCQSHKFRSWCPTLTRSRSRSLETLRAGVRVGVSIFKTLESESESESESHKKMRTPHPWRQLTACANAANKVMHASYRFHYSLQQDNTSHRLLETKEERDLGILVMCLPSVLKRLRKQ